jgi:hypothetical protein
MFIFEKTDGVQQRGAKRLRHLLALARIFWNLMFLNSVINCYGCESRAICMLILSSHHRKLFASKAFDPSPDPMQTINNT